MKTSQDESSFSKTILLSIIQNAVILKSVPVAYDGQCIWGTLPKMWDVAARPSHVSAGERGLLTSLRLSLTGDRGAAEGN